MSMRGRRLSCSIRRSLHASSQRLAVQEVVSDASDVPRKYVLSQFPYPSGKLHIGHVRVYTISDCIAQYHRMRGRRVLHPMGWDSFGLPAENAAIEHQLSPSEWTNSNIAHMRKQMDSLGFRFDWTEELSTCSPQYYRWTQWLFLQLYQAGLAYQQEAVVNWDPVDRTVLANEQVDENGCSWRSGAAVEQRYLMQWFFKITDYAEKLLNGLQELDWPNSVKTMQEKWIGKSVGSKFDFSVQLGDVDWKITAFTTRPETIFGVTFLALSSDHELVVYLKQSNPKFLKEFEAVFPNSFQNQGNENGKKGVALGVSAMHPLTGEVVPVFVADYVVSGYGTKAVMGVPAHDVRDQEFAETFQIPSHKVVDGGVLVGSRQFDGLHHLEGREAIVKLAEELNVGGRTVQYRLRDWLVSRQRYWGTPIPMVNCAHCGMVPVSVETLPVVLPLDIKISGRGQSPLTTSDQWRSTLCPKCGGVATRECDTMDTFVDSAWYFLRFTDSHNKCSPFEKYGADMWMPVDIYVGGVEHAILHLLYARFINHFLFDIGCTSHKEPFSHLLTQGMVHGKTFKASDTGMYFTSDQVFFKGDRAFHVDSQKELVVSWEKMSKSKHNGVDPEEVVDKYGGDVVRLFVLFKAPPEAVIQWDIKAIQGIGRWVKRLETLVNKHEAAVRGCGSEKDTVTRDTSEIVSAAHRAIKQVTEVFDGRYTFNVAIAELMTLSNILGIKSHDCHVTGSVEYHEALCSLCIMLCPMAPSLSRELWQGLIRSRKTLKGQELESSVSEAKWPPWSADMLNCDASVNVVIQINGQKKCIIQLPSAVAFNNMELKRKTLEFVLTKGYLDTEPSSVVVAPLKATTGQLVNFIK